MKTKETFFQELENKTNTFFNSLLSECDISINDYINIENIIDIDNLESFDHTIIFESITESLQENGGFNLEIIYYSNAIDYLKKHDPSLTESLNIALEFCFEVQNLNSEVLASLLYSQNETENYYSLESDITDFFSDIETEINDFLESAEA